MKLYVLHSCLKIILFICAISFVSANETPMKTYLRHDSSSSIVNNADNISTKDHMKDKYTLLDDKKRKDDIGFVNLNNNFQFFDYIIPPSAITAIVQSSMERAVCIARCQDQKKLAWGECFRTCVIGPTVDLLEEDVDLIGSEKL